MGDVVDFEKGANIFASENALMFCDLIESGMGVKGSFVAWVADDGLVYWQAAEGTPEDAVNSMASVILTVTALQLRGVPEEEE